MASLKSPRTHRRRHSARMVGYWVWSCLSDLDLDLLAYSVTLVHKQASMHGIGRSLYFRATWTRPSACRIIVNTTAAFRRSRRDALRIEAGCCSISHSWPRPNDYQNISFIVLWAASLDWLGPERTGLLRDSSSAWLCWAPVVVRWYLCAMEGSSRSNRLLLWPNSVVRRVVRMVIQHT